MLVQKYHLSRTYTILQSIFNLEYDHEKGSGDTWVKFLGSTRVTWNAYILYFTEWKKSNIYDEIFISKSVILS